MRETSCAPAYILGLLGRKWAYRTLRHLRGPLRFSEIAARLPTITHHVLTEELHILVGEGLVDHDENTYVLSTAGLELLTALDALISWTEGHKGLASCPAEQACANCARYREDTTSRR